MSAQVENTVLINASSTAWQKCHLHVKESCISKQEASEYL